LLSRSKIIPVPRNRPGKRKAHPIDAEENIIYPVNKKVGDAVEPVHESGAKPSVVHAAVVLSGGSGMVGRAVHRALTARGARVLQLVRGEAGSSSQLHWNPEAAMAFRDTEPLEGFAAAIHLSGANVAAHRWTAAYKQEIWRSRVQSTRALAEAVAGLRRRPEVMIVASATGIYGDRGDEILDETAAPGKGFLADVCQEWELAARPASEAGIRVVHTRFGVVVGPGDGALAKMLPLFKLGLGGRLGSGKQWMSWVSLEDVVGAILFALGTRAVAGPVNVTAPNPVTNAEFTRALAKAVHRPAILPAPAFALRLAMGEMADEALLASARAVPAKLSQGGFRFAYPTIEGALEHAVAAPETASNEG
jgi:uncharacterized protein (TIGR01777 family)